SAGNRACTHGTRRHGAALSMSAHHQVVSVLLTVLLGLPAVAAREPQLPLPSAAGNPQSAERGPLPGPPGPLRLRPAMLADNIVELAGRDVVILNARVVGVFEPHALLIEPAVRYLEPMRFRTRLLVLMRDRELQIDEALLVGSTVQVSGVARTLLGMKVSAEVSWPAQLDDKRLDRLDVRASVLATSIQTPEGIELTAPRRDR